MHGRPDARACERWYAMPPKLVIFDCDGVLVDTEGVANGAVADNLSRYGPRLTAAEYANGRSDTKNDDLPSANGHHRGGRFQRAVRVPR